MTKPSNSHPSPAQIKAWIQTKAYELGFSACAISAPDAQHQLPFLQQFLADGFAADMDYLANNIEKRANPRLLLEGIQETKSIICVRMNYLADAPPNRYIPDQPNSAIVSRYAYGRDYHKVLRARLKQLALAIEAEFGQFNWRPFTDSAPILEKALAEQSGLGWTGKHTLLINKTEGSFFFLAELFTDLDLPFDTPATSHCGTCQACIDICPTQAIVAPYRLDARRCISYLTIENTGVIPVEFRQAIGNRVFGCDDCQLICPWNSFAKLSNEADFKPRNRLDQITLLEMWQWTENQFLQLTEGSAIRRTGYLGLMRNVAVALGNAPKSQAVINALLQKRGQLGDMVDEHIDWAEKNLTQT